MQLIKVQPEVAQKTTVVIEGRRYRLRLRFNTRTQAWYLSIAKTDGTKLVSGMRIVPTYHMLHQYNSNAELPSGLLLAEDPLTFEELRWLWYHTISEVNAALQAAGA